MMIHRSSYARALGALLSVLALTAAIGAQDIPDSVAAPADNIKVKLVKNYKDTLTKSDEWSPAQDKRDPAYYHNINHRVWCSSDEKKNGKWVEEDWPILCEYGETWAAQEAKYVCNYVAKDRELGNAKLVQIKVIRSPGKGFRRSYWRGEHTKYGYEYTWQYGCYFQRP